MYICMYSHTHVYTHIHTHVYEYIRMYTLHTFIHMYRVYIHMCVSTKVLVKFNLHLTPRSIFIVIYIVYGNDSRRMYGRKHNIQDPYNTPERVK